MKIALIGKARTGKDTVGEYLIAQHNCIRFAFGDEVGEVVKRYFPESFAEGKPRQHYQLVGQAFRELNPNIWIERTLDRINKLLLLNPEANIVVTDVRQPNEAQALEEQGFLLVKVTCSDSTRIERMCVNGDVFRPEQLVHETETNVDLCEYDLCITNESTLAKLHEETEMIVKYAKEKFPKVLRYRFDTEYYKRELMKKINES